MLAKDLRGIIVNIFLILSLFSIFFYIYRIFNPFDFPGLWERIFYFNIGFGIVALVSYYNEIIDFLNRFEIKLPKRKRKFKRKIEFKKWKLKKGGGSKTLTKIKLKKPKFQLKKPKFHIKKPEIRIKIFLPKINWDKIENRFISIKFFFVKLIRRIGRLPKRTKLKILGFFVGLVIYSTFLIWVYPKFSFDEFMFFALLGYVPISIIFSLDPRYPIGIALLLLIICAIVLFQGFEDYANRIAIYAYYGLVVGVILMFVDYVRNSNKDNFKI
ncbi:MAG: hypothetical protein GF368_01870 [Candidatus Aenigmarchaeota archaeon]|nr:hypothetical protein [Candidatus Aenigmarchaeota archaeon]